MRLLRWLILALGLSGAAYAQAPDLTPTPIQHFVDNNGNACVGCRLYVYAAGTTTKITTFTDATGGVPTTNPIIMNTRGEPQNTMGNSIGVWVPPGAPYKLVYAPANDTDPPTNPFWTLDNINSAPASGTVSNNTQLSALASSASSAVRLGFATAGDSPSLIYIASNSACSLHGGAGDGGSQVSTSDGKCWIASFPSSGADARSWGAKGSGSSGDGAANAAAIQAAITAVSLLNIPLWIVDGRYYTTTGFTAPAVVDIRGSNGTSDIYISSCVNGLVATTDITMLRISGVTGTVQNLCIEMAPTAGTRTSGAGILVGGTSSTQQGHVQITGNTVLNGYNGILLGGGTTGSTQSNGDVIAGNVIISASHFGIGIGVGNTGGSAPGTVVSHNQIFCAAAQSAAVGMELQDGAATIEFGDGGPFGCNIGTEVRPGAGQVVGATSITGVVGDSSITHDLFISPTDVTAFVYDLTFAGSWTGSTLVTDQSVLVEDTVSAPVQDIKFVGHTFYGNGGGGGGSASPLVKFNSFGVSMTGSQVIASGYVLTTGVEIGASSGLTNLSGNTITASAGGGTITNGIKIDSGAATFAITGNSIIATNPVIYTPAGESAVISHNLGLDNTCPTVASGTTISIPNAAPCINITGSTAITDIAASQWSRRVVTLRSNDGVALNTGGSANTKFCNTVTLSAAQSILAQYDNVGNCWALL